MSEPSNEQAQNRLDESQQKSIKESEQVSVEVLDDRHSEVEESQSDPGAAELEIAQLKEAMLRLRAEMENREKRVQREMVKARKFALENLIQDFIQVLDSFDQAIAQHDAGSSEGVSLTHKLAVKVLASHGLEVVEPLGEPFDPSWHEAMVAQPTDQQAPDTVLDVLQKGYRLHDRLIRPARVVVAKAID